MDTKSCEVMTVMEGKDGSLTARSAESGEEVHILSKLQKVEDLDFRKREMVALTPQEASMLQGLNRHERRKWLKQERMRRRKASKMR